MRSWLVVAVVLLGGCADAGELGSATTTRDLPRVRELTPAEAEAALAGLPRSDRDTDASTYARDAFGEAWSDIDGNGCNQRDDVLLRDALPGTTTISRQGPCGHDVLAGTWVDPYTGDTVELDDLKDLAQAQTVQIDHVVPLAEAWRSGASRWSDGRREAFANDLAALAATYGPTNASKSDSDPAAWRPGQEFQCDYALLWIAVKAVWELSVDDSEAAALTQMLARCPRSRQG